MAAFRCEAKSVGGALDLFAIVGRVQREAIASRDARHIGRITEDVGCGGECRAYLRRDQRFAARPYSRNGQRAHHSAAFMRRLSPYTSTIAKYGQSVSPTSASRTTRSPGMVPRSISQASARRPADTSARRTLLRLRP